MATKTSKPQAAAKTPTIAYQSNPFSLSFDKFGLFFEKNLGWAIVLIVVPILYFFLQMLGAALDTTTASAHSAAHHAANSEVTPWLAATVVFLVAFSAIIIAAIIFVSVAFNSFISGVFAYVALENDAGRTASFRGAIDAVVARFWRLLLAQLLATVKIFGWTLLFIIPGIVAAFRYTLLPYLIMDEPATKKGVKESHERIKTLVKGRKREIFGVATVATIIPVVGSINQVVGNAALYRQLQVFSDKKLQKAPVHWLNYFGFILIGLYILLIAFVIAIAILAESTQPL
ncbi:MAG: hypothetical protein Q7T74_00320 [Candidatus Saccharibacteria bacterium]|nr:hypothetical protein [Candidatus Saccharibacteria bacterium]